jgi:hypothetical protein
MRELEFLPGWYPQLRRRRSLVKIQGWVLVAMIVGLSLWAILVGRAVRKDEAKLVQLDAALSESRAELEQLDELLALEKQLGKQEQIMAKVGSHVEAARLLATLDEVMPPEMALVDLSFDTEDRVVQPATPTGSRFTRAAANAAPPVIDRRLKVRLVAVAPTDVDLANFLARLTGKPFFEAVAMTYARDRSEQGHLMREFEVLFSMDLNEQ